MLVGFSGSRYLQAGSVAQGAILCLLAQVQNLGFSVATGCCPSGADFFVRSAWPSASVFVAQGQTPAELRARTLQMVQAVSCLFVFPVSVQVAHSGSWLSAFAAVSCGKPVFVFLPGVPASQLPCCKGVVGWQPVSCQNLSKLVSLPAGFFSPVVAQASLFSS